MGIAFGLAASSYAGNVCPPNAADASAQRAIQAAVNREVAALNAHNLAEAMAAFTHDYQGVDVTGGHVNYLQTQANVAKEVARNKKYPYQCHVADVRVTGSRANAMSFWHYQHSYSRTATSPAYVFRHDFVAQTTWRKSMSGWQEERAQATRDATTYLSATPVPTFSSHGTAADTQVQWQIQAVVNLTADGYQRRNIAQAMAMYAPNYVVTNVQGKRYGVRDLAASSKADLNHSDFHLQCRCAVSSVIVESATAYTVLRWQFDDQHTPANKTPAYRYSRDYVEQAVWQENRGQWRQTRGQVTHDTFIYARP